MRLCLTQDHALVWTLTPLARRVSKPRTWAAIVSVGDTPFALVKLFGVLAFLP